MERSRGLKITVEQICYFGIQSIEFTLSYRYWLRTFFAKRACSRWSVTSFWGPGDRNFNAVSHQPTLAPIQFNSICSRQLWLMGYGIKISFPRPPQWRHRSPSCLVFITLKGIWTTPLFCLCIWILELILQNLQVWSTSEAIVLECGVNLINTFTSQVQFSSLAVVL